MERIAISIAVLNYLAGNDNLVFVSMHREVGDPLSESYKQYHFTEVIQDDEMYSIIRLNRNNHLHPIPVFIFRYASDVTGRMPIIGSILL